MSTEKATGVVLRTVDFSETSVVATLFTREFGKVTGLAKGARRLKSPFDSALDLLSTVRVVFLRKSADTLSLWTEAKLLRRFRPTRRDLADLYAACSVVELIDRLTDQFDPHAELFDLVDATLIDLAERNTIPQTLLRFEVGMLRLLGHAPATRDCVGCGQAVVYEKRVAFGLIDGGVLCADCRQGRKEVVGVSAAAIRLLERLGESARSADDEVVTRNRETGESRVDRAVFRELQGIVSRYVTNLIGHRPRMHRYRGVIGATLKESARAVASRDAARDEARRGNDGGRIDEQTGKASEDAAASGHDVSDKEVGSCQHTLDAHRESPDTR